MKNKEKCMARRKEISGKDDQAGASLDGEGETNP
jgi:hypothetical protein